MYVRMDSDSLSIKQVFYNGLQLSLVHQGVIILFDKLNWSSPLQRIGAIVIGVIVKLLMTFTIDGSMIYILTILSNDKTYKVVIRILIWIGLVVVNLGELITNMGIVWSQHEDRKKADEDRKKDRKKADEDRKKAENRHLEIISAITSNAGVTNDEIGVIVNEFKHDLLQEHKKIILQQINEVVLDATTKLDATIRYDLVDHITEREKCQRQLSKYC